MTRGGRGPTRVPRTRVLLSLPSRTWQGKILKNPKEGPQKKSTPPPLLRRCMGGKENSAMPTRSFS